MTMTMKTELLVRFAGKGDNRLFWLPDLTLWYDWHRKRETLPDGWQGLSLSQVARRMGAPIWIRVTPWKMTYSGVNVSVTQTEAERAIRAETPSGVLTSRWMLGPDGDWWQVEYPIKRSDDLQLALEWAVAREYVVDARGLEGAVDEVGDDGIVAVNIPKCPYAELLGDLLGWSDGLIFLGEPEVAELLDILEGKLQGVVKQIARLPGDVFFSPDNLDGQFVSPRVFERHFAKSYRATMEALAVSGKPLVVHAGGPISRLLKPLADAGVSAVEGVCGPPQGDTTLAEAREVAGPTLTLWGGIPQDMLTGAHSEDEFEVAVQQAIEDARGDSRALVGVADMIPTRAQVSRLKRLAELMAH